MRKVVGSSSARLDRLYLSHSEEDRIVFAVLAYTVPVPHCVLRQYTAKEDDTLDPLPYKSCSVHAPVGAILTPTETSHARGPIAPEWLTSHPLFKKHFVDVWCPVNPSKVGPRIRRVSLSH